MSRLVEFGGILPEASYVAVRTSVSGLVHTASGDSDRDFEGEFDELTLGMADGQVYPERTA